MSRGAKVLPDGAAAANVSALARLYGAATSGAACTACRGAGYVILRGHEKVTCPKCKGTGRP